MNTTLSKLTQLGLCTFLLASTTALAEDISGFAGVRMGWMDLNSERTASFDNNTFEVRDGLRTFTPGVELGLVIFNDLAFRVYYDHLNAEYQQTSSTARGFSAGADMLFGFSQGLYGGVGINHTDIGDQHATGARVTGGYRYNFSERISSRVEVAYQQSATSTERELQDVYVGAIVQATFGQQRRPAQARPEPYNQELAQAQIPDADGDGVPDYLDLCPATSANSTVNEYGCSRHQNRDHRFEAQVYFALNSAELQSQYQDEIASFAEHLRQNPDLRLRIEGHTDSSGADWRNRQLSQQRADAVKRVLVEEFGVNPSRVDAEGFSDTRPLNYGDVTNPANRRIEVVFEDSPADTNSR